MKSFKIERLFLIFLILLFFLLSCSKLNKPQQEQKGQEAASNEIISHYSTKILDKTNSRISNLNLAASKINGYLIKPGEVFSFNQVVGEASEENGFKKAITLDEKGNKVLDDGGGVCQISSTLYNAAKKSGMEIVERHSHSRNVGYVKKGNDAAIGYGVKDFKFKNTKEYSVKIVTSITKEKVNISLVKENVID